MRAGFAGEWEVAPFKLAAGHDHAGYERHSDRPGGEHLAVQRGAAGHPFTLDGELKVRVPYDIGHGWSFWSLHRSEGHLDQAIVFVEWQRNVARSGDRR